MHRISNDHAPLGAYYLETAGLRAMVAPDDEAVEEVGVGSVAADGNAIDVVSLNVDGLGVYRATPAERMGAILSELLRAEPNVIMLQEVVEEMYAVLKNRLPGWRLFRRRGHDFP